MPFWRGRSGIREQREKGFQIASNFPILNIHNLRYKHQKARAKTIRTEASGVEPAGKALFFNGNNSICCYRYPSPYLFSSLSFGIELGNASSRIIFCRRGWSFPPPDGDTIVSSRSTISP